MASKVVVVESPAKAKTIGKYLGKDYEILASYGHVRDLVPKEGAVDTGNGYRMRYEVIERNTRHVDAIARAVKKADAVYLATDPDREGEAISWHLAEILRERGVLDGRELHRVVFYEITEREVREAMQGPRQLSADLVNAQQARRALDYLVGFNLSPLLWKKVQPKLSAGRVQSPALRLICEREDEIEAFRPREYWSIEADLRAASAPFAARLAEFRGEKVEQFSFGNETAASAARQALLDAAGGRARVSAIEKKQRRRNPAPPFTTSTLQQEASRKLGYNARRTMMIAQRLYEGVETGEGTVGLITYMRTDSVNLASVAIDEIRGFIASRYGSDNLPAQPRSYKTSAKNAQEAHEGVRPTSVARTPESLRQFLSEEQFRLYDLIWKRTVACQMVPAVYDMVTVDLTPTRDPAVARLRASGSTLVVPGFIAVYQEGRDDAAEEEGDRILPPLREGDDIDLVEVRADQHFTEPPPRYNDATLVKALEEFGIGRPSTYASIISTLQDRGYIEVDGKRFIPKDIGRIVNRFLTDHFTRYVDYGFTAHMEDELDEVSRGERDWVQVLDEFWQPFAALVKDKEASVTREMVAQARDLGIDPASGKPVSVRMGRFGPFAQIGTKDDAEKPRFAGLRPGQKMASITLDEALALFQLPRKLGTTADGEPVQASVGRFGPYVQYGKKYVSLKPPDDPYTVTLERALQVIEEKKVADANRLILDFPEAGIQVLNGRYGPYITDRERNARIPKGEDPKSLTLDQCRELLAAAPPRGKRGFRGRKAAPAKAPAEAPQPKKAAKPAKRKASKTSKTNKAGKAADAAAAAPRKPRARRAKGSPDQAPGDSSG
ncbi:MAG: DNA topoisomerase 1 [Gammaproteobacteria bacterium]|nr:MAG: DNA topoisomerase I [Pseudomonadota bacterium]MBC6945004.1 DNA topoisomerase I [Gammaproteobacteria bacterium]MCE7897426.1 DNA topoisomerase I [Gammaproteobacteria bacterium PRO8]MDL1879717.1 DNA topoisomerase I [Gammaproteobacteria bacterium PRO2]MCQ3933620.1 DNA topoisomerase I [Gammaproteobacteria bacterium]